MKLTTWVCCALLTAMPGAAGAQETLVIDFVGVRIEAPIPEGYCPLTASDKAATDLIAAADAHNVTHATLSRCHGDGSQKDYYLIKSPRHALALSIPRAELLAEMAQHFGRAEWQAGGKTANDLIETTSRQISDTLNTPTEVNGDFGGRGTDEDCAYIGGEAIVSLGDLTYPIQGGGCMTSVGNKILTVYVYDEPKGAEGVALLMRKARDFAMAFTVTPVVTPP